VALDDYDQVRERIARVQQRLNADVNEIRENRSYTNQGRKREIAKATLQAKTQVAKIRAEHVADRTARRDKFERLAFGIVGEVDAGTLIAVRDAQDRADKITTEDDAAAMLHRATQTNDASLASAIGLRAYNRGWTDVATNWADAWDKTAYLEEFHDIPGGKNTTAADSLIFRVPAPQELSGLTDPDIKTIAEAEVSA
jgi:hypothetical protein